MNPRWQYSVSAFALAIASLIAAGVAGVLPGVPALFAESPKVDLVAERRTAGIADCPVVGDGPAVHGGLPEITLECLGGGKKVPMSGLRGPMLISFWAQWCDRCGEEAADLADFARTQTKVAVLGINYSDSRPGSAIAAARLAGATYPQLSDPQGRLREPLRIPGVPFALLIDADGKIVARHAGEFFSAGDLRDWVALGLTQ